MSDHEHQQPDVPIREPSPEPPTEPSPEPPAEPDLGDINEIAAKLGAEVARELAPLIQYPHGQITTIAQVPLRRVRWLWTQRIPMGMLTLLAGEPGISKTALVLHLAARVTRGQLAGDREQLPGDVLYIGAEDAPDTIIAPRLTAAGADPERIIILERPGAWTIEYVHGLIYQIDQYEGRDIAAVIVDPLDAHLPGAVDSHRKAEVQRACAMLTEAIIERWPDAAVVGVAHLNKRTDERAALWRLVGSIGWVSAARTILTVGYHPEAPDVRALNVVKSNSGAFDVPAWCYRVEGVTVTADDGEPITTAGIVELGEEPDLAAEETLSRPSGAMKREDVAAWLEEVLADGPLAVKAIEQLAADEQISRRTLYRARDLLVERGALVSERDHRTKRQRTWRLLGHG